MLSRTENVRGVSSLAFKLYTDEQVKTVSVKEIVSEFTFDNLGMAVEGGIFDPAFGPTDPLSTCITCELPYHSCPGHRGHIQLAAPVFHPMMFQYVLKLLNVTCFHCHRLRVSSRQRKAWEAQITDKSTKTRKAVLKEMLSPAKQTCSHCGLNSPRFRCTKNWKILQVPLSDSHREKNASRKAAQVGIQDAEDEEETAVRQKAGVEMESDDDFQLEQGIDASSTRLVFVTEARKHIECLWNSADGRLLHECFRGIGGYKCMFMQNVLVSASKYRPPSQNGDAMEHALNGMLRKLILCNQAFAKASSTCDIENLDQGEDQPKDAAEARDALVETWLELQNTINCMYDTGSNMIKKDAPLIERLRGVRQLLDKKEGLFRKHMMGKRVNYAARSVISPDPYISTNEVGVPSWFAKKLTYPEPVTQYNLEKLQLSIINGADVHPGANYVVMADGQDIALGRLPQEERVRLAKTLQVDAGVKVLRHLENGDVLLANRQPTLHKPGIMAHKARVLPKEQTIRLHYANCNTYNADFDGDEINLHFPQDPVARAEAYEMAATDLQYVVPKDGTPLRGLIQDHVVGGVLLTKKDSFFSKAQYQQLLYAACQGLIKDTQSKIHLEPPTLLKPEPLWTGKQIMTSVLKNLTGDKHGITMQGKTKIPAACWGPQHASESSVHVRHNVHLHGVLDKSQFGASSYGLVHCVYEVYGPGAAGRLLTSLGLLFSTYIQRQRGFSCGLDDMLLDKQQEKTRKRTLKASKNVGVQASMGYVQDYIRATDNEDEIADAMRVKLKRSPQEQTSLDSAVKSALNAVTSDVIKSALSPGQDDGLYKKFPQNNLALMTMSGAKGSNVNFSQISCLLGQQELEGKRVPRTKSGRTLPSFRAYDPSARAGGFIADRFLTGVRPQEYYFHCMAGREGLVDTAVKTSRSGYLQRCLVKHLENLVVGYDETVRDHSANGRVVQFNYGEDGVDVMQSAFLYNQSKFPFLEANQATIVQSLHPKAALKALDSTSATEAWSKPHKDPILSQFNPATHLGAVSEAFQSLLDSYHQTSMSKDKFEAMMWLKYIASLSCPGEPVGVLAAQSIGEPSTQMTLNTFHLAGFGGANVTLGIPRLREIIMTASKSISTPLMQCFTQDGSEESAAKLLKELQRAHLKDVCREIRLCENTELQSRTKRFNVRLQIDTAALEALHMSMKGLVSIVRTKLVSSLISHSLEEFIIPQENTDETSPEGMDADESSNDSDADSSDVEESAEKEGTPMQVDDAADNNMPTKPTSRKVSRKGDMCLEACKVYDDAIELTLAYDIDSCTSLMTVRTIQNCVDTCVLKQKKKIGSCYSVQPGNKLARAAEEYAVQTDGVNFRALWDLDPAAWKLDLSRVYSNDVHAVLETYGVEAARAVLVQEIRSVFAVYGISVNPRHLYLLADYMTSGGGYKALNRLTMRTASSPLLKMTFETSSQFLQDSIFNGEEDTLQTSSSNILVGQTVPFGTGAFDILNRVVF